MNAIFSINFRREAFQRQRARTRRRALQLGLWVLYFGALGVVLGLYGLNIASIQRRISLVQRHVERFRSRASSDDWRPARGDAAEVDRHLRSPRVWRDRLGRLPTLLPSNARLSSLQFNPENAAGTSDLKLVISGDMRRGGGEEGMQQVMSFVNALSRDSVFAASFRNIRLVTTRAASGADGAAFVIECR